MLAVLEYLQGIGEIRISELKERKENNESIKNQILEKIETLKKDYTIIIVTHNMQQATRISDYTAFFMLGEIVEYEQTEKLFRNPKNKKTEDYITGRFG